MAILQGIKIEGSEEVHQIDYESAVANKPFYEETTTLFEWDGDTTGLEYIEITEDGVTEPYLYKVTDEVHTYDEFLGSKATANVSGTEQTMDITSDVITQFSDGLFNIGNFAFVALEDTEYEGFAFTKGIWHMNLQSTSGTYVKEVAKETVKQIDKKYIEATAEDEGKFLRVTNGVATWETLTDVSEVGA